MTFEVIRPVYLDWSMNLRIQYDTNTWTLQEVTTLVAAVGALIGLGNVWPDTHAGFFAIEAVNDSQRRP